jgi:predicted enzyme related to lactoylglutathione lyase
MANPVVHVEIIGPHPEALRIFYKKVFDWDSVTDPMVPPEVSVPGTYGFIENLSAGGSSGVAGGIGGGGEFKAQTIVYIGVEEVEVALRQAEQFGGERRLGPITRTSGGLVVAHFRDPAGNIIGLAGPK